MIECPLKMGKGKILGEIFLTLHEYDSTRPMTRHSPTSKVLMTEDKASNRPLSSNFILGQKTVLKWELPI